MHDTLTITKVDESFVKLDGPPHIIYELADEFTFKAKNYKFHPLYKNRVWDGNIRLLNKTTRKIYLGLTRRICNWAKERDYKVVVTDPTDFGEAFSEIEANNFIKSLNLPSKYTERDYQFKAFVDAIRDKRSIVVSPTASGKSLIMYLMTRKYMDMMPDSKGLIIVPRTSLVEQLYTDFQDYGWNSENHCVRIYSGQDRTLDRDVTISTWQSLQNMPKEFFHKFEWIIGDEAHLFEAKSLSKIMENLIHASFRTGTTGSIDDGPVHELTLEGHFGKTRTSASTDELMKQGYLSDLSIKAIILKHDKDICTERKKNKWTYHQEIDYLIANEERNRFITNLACSLENNTLVLYNHVENHGNQLETELKHWVEKNASDKKVFYIHGGVKTSVREDIRKYVSKHNNCIILASYGTFSTGINIPNLQNVIFALGFKSKIRNLQSIGRGLRLDEKNNKVTLFDISDDMTSGNNVGFSMRHFKVRLELYFKENFKVKLYKVSLPKPAKLLRAI